MQIAAVAPVQAEASVELSESVRAAAALRSIEGSQIPLLVFINSRSGGGEGGHLLRRFREWLGDEQVCDLGQVGRGGPAPDEVLAKYVSMARVRVLICGGDGTCSWLLTAIAKVCADAGCDASTTFPAAVMPLGTGNDLSRALGWGPRYARAMCRKRWLQRIALAETTLLDRWSITVDGAAPGLPRQFVAHQIDGGDGGAVRQQGMVYNYFGIGAEAAGLHGFHVAREANPHKFKSALGNLPKMIMHGAPNVGLCAPCGCHKPYPSLSKAAKISVRTSDDADAPWQPVELPRKLAAVILLNIRSHAAGRHMWEPILPPWAPQSSSDGTIEVCGMASIAHAGMYLMCGFGHLRPCSAIRLGQAKAVRIELLQPTHVQVDGEPWLQGAGEMMLSLAGKNAMLSAPTRREMVSKSRA
jgi:diacylglycerol kinase (ATP)